MATGPSADTIKQSIPIADTPMGVLQAIMNKPEATTPVATAVDTTKNDRWNPQVVADTIKQIRDEELKYDENLVPKDSDTPVKTEEIKLEAEPVKEDFSPNTLLETVTGKDLSIKKLRDTISETKKTLKEKEELFSRAQEELEEYKTGKKIPEYAFELEKKVQDLSKYQELHALKTSPSYQEKYVKPLSELKDKLYTLGKDYDLPPEILDQALNLTNKKELGGWLEDHFTTVDSIEAKRYIDEVQALTGKAREAELEPAKVLKQIEEENEQFEFRRKASLTNTNNERSTKAWAQSLHAIKLEGKVKELIYREDDSEYNEKYVDPHVQAAATEFSKIVARITSKLNQPLDEEEMAYFAKMSLLAHASASLSERASSTESKARAIYTNTTRMNGMYRPPVGDGHGRSGYTPPAPPETQKDRVDQLLEKGRAMARTK